MKIGMVGSGKVGSALGSWLAKSGLQVGFASKSKSSAESAAAKAGHRAMAFEMPELVKQSDVLLLTLPYQEIESALAPVSRGLARKVLVDVSNPITQDHLELTVGHNTSGAEEIAKLFPEASVVKAFNAVFAEVYQAQRTYIGEEQISVFYAGDDKEAKGEIRKLIGALGFDPVDAGPLKNARYLEPLSLLNIHLGRVLGFGTQIGFSLAREEKATTF